MANTSGEEKAENPAAELGETPTAARKRHASEGAERLLLYLVIVAVIVLSVVFLVYAHIQPETQAATNLATLTNRPNLHPFCGGLLLIVANIARSGLALRFVVTTIGALISMVGGMMVLKGVEAAYELRATRAEASMELRTASPGLVMITLGVVLLLAALGKETTANLKDSERCLEPSTEASTPDNRPTEASDTDAGSNDVVPLTFTPLDPEGGIP